MIPMERKRNNLKDIDEISSESSVDLSEDNDMFEEYLQECYYSNYCAFETQARQNNYIVDVYNHNPKHPWQN
jgi:hypothetical protein